MKMFNKRTISLLLVLAMICGVMPVMVLAADETEFIKATETFSIKMELSGVSSNTISSGKPEDAGYYAACGDSITHANHALVEDINTDDKYYPIDGYSGTTYARKNYAYYIAESNNLQWANYGYGGTTLHHCYPKGYGGTSMRTFPFVDERITQLKEDIEWNYISIFFGYNDVIYGPVQQRDFWLTETYGKELGYPVKDSQIGTEGFANAEQKAACDAAIGSVGGVEYTDNTEYFFAKFVGTVDDTETTTFLGAYNYALDYLTKKYPDAKILIVNPYVSGTNNTRKIIRDGVNAIAEKWGVSCMDFSDLPYWFYGVDQKRVEFPNPHREDGRWVQGNGKGTFAGTIEGYNRARFTTDGTHPSNLGYQTISKPIGRALIDSDNTVNVLQGEPFEAELILDDIYTGMDVSITMGGTDITDRCYANGKIWIESVTGDVIIRANGNITYTDGHTYSAEITAPTCTEQGYTTYTCECGESYVGDYVDALGHIYKGLVCDACGKAIQPIAGDSELYITVAPDNYWTISNMDTEKLSCGPGMVAYGEGNFAVAYLADDINTVETESSTTIVCRLGLFNIKDPEHGEFLDVATVGQNIGDITIGERAPYEPNLMQLSDSKLLILFNIHTTSGKYIYYGAVFDTVSNTIETYQPLTLDGKEWTPANIAASYNALAENSISTSGPAGSMVFTSRIIQHEGYYYGYCGGISNGFSGILVRSVDGINWESVMTPEAAGDMKGVIECGFQFLDDSVYFCMRDISSGVYHCAYRFSTGEQLKNTQKLPGLTTSKPTAFIQNGEMYLIVNKYTGDDNTVGRRNTAQIYRVNPETFGLILVKQVFCKDGCAYHTVVEYGGINYWCFHTDARRINPYSQGRSNLAFLPMPTLVESSSENGELNFDVFTNCYANGCITGATNSWQAGAVNMHYQIPLAVFADYDAVTITANDANKCYLAFFTKKMISQTQVAYAEGWTEQLIMEPGTSQTLSIPEDAQYLYILATNAAGNDLIPESVVFHTHAYESVVTTPTCTEQGYTTHTCKCGDSYVSDYLDALGHKFGQYISNDDATVTSDGTKTAVCERDGCKAADTVTDAGTKLLLGDMNNDKCVDTDDAIYLLRHILMPDSYCVKQSANVNGDDVADTDDAIYLLRHVLLPNSYPLKPEK